MNEETANPAVTSKPKPAYDYKELLMAPIWKDNPVFIKLLALCPALGVTSNVFNSAGLGIITMAAIIIINVIISLIAKFVPDEVRIPVFITVIAAVITIMEMVTQAFVPALFSALGIFIALIVTNCVIMGQAESFARKNPVLPALVDGIGNGLGILIAMVMLGVFREGLGRGTLSLGFTEIFLFPAEYALGIFVMPQGAFIVLGVICGFIFTARIAKEEAKKAAAKAAKATK